MVSWDSLVEATIDCIRVDSVNNEVRIEVTCAWEGKERARIVATGVDDFVLNEMRVANIVQQVNRFDTCSENEVVPDLLNRLFFLMRGEEPSPSDLEWPALHEKLARIQDGTLVLLDIEPVYGAAILLLAKAFRLETITTESRVT